MNESQQLTLPVAIVVAGLLIAGAVFFSRSGGTTPTAQASPVFFDQVVADLDLNEDEFLACLESDAAINAVIADTDEVLALGGQGTPYSLIITEDGTFYAISGAIPYESSDPALPGFKAQIDAIKNGSTDLVPLSDELTANFRPVTNDDFIRGTSDASLTVVEYSDFECPFCSRHHPTLDRLVSEDSDVRWVYRHFPLASIHPQATAAALAGECVAEQAGNDGFWYFADFIFANQQLLQTAPYQG